MSEIEKVLKRHPPKSVSTHTPSKEEPPLDRASFSEIPDLFFDQILVKFKLSRIEIMVLMYLYRDVWCRPNPHREFGIGPIYSFDQMSREMGLYPLETSTTLKKLEELGFIECIRMGQYFVRRYFTKELDTQYHSTYGEF